MKSNTLTNKNDCQLVEQSIDEFDSYNNRELEEDRCAVLLVVMFAFCFGLLIGVFATSLYADESVDKNTTSEGMPQTTMAPGHHDEWRPPVAKNVLAPKPIDDEQIEKIKQEYGIEIQSLNVTAGGYMMDFRFRVLEAKKSEIFFDHRIKPYLHVKKSNAKLPVPMAAKVGAFRTTDRGKNIKPNKNYYIVFANPDAHVKRGDKVTLVVGDFKAEDMSVH